MKNKTDVDREDGCGGSGRDDGDEDEQQLERKEAHREALNNDDVDMKIILKIMMRITDPLIKEEIRQRSILK